MAPDPQNTPDEAPDHDQRRTRVVRTPGRYGVLLNALAKGWTGAIHQDVQRYVSSRDLFLTDDFRQAERTVDKLLDAGYDAIFTGGGDGTVMYLVNALENRIQDGKISRQECPPVGVLKLGTGNAIATYLGAGPITEDLRALRAGAPLVVNSVDMVEGAEGLFPFAGIGWDAEILNDYESLKGTVRDTPFENYATGLGGYFASTFGRTIPKVVRQDPVHVRITNQAERAHRIAPDGQVLEEYEEGALLYDGPARVCGISSIPYWGFKIKMFPHTTKMPGYCQMRVFNGTAGWIVTHLNRFWRGEFRDEDCEDFLISKVRLDVEGRPMPYQIGGDAAGYERVIDWRVAAHPCQLAVPLR